MGRRGSRSRFRTYGIVFSVERGGQTLFNVHGWLHHKGAAPNMKGQILAHTSHSKISTLIAAIGLMVAILVVPTGTTDADTAESSDQSSLALITIPNPKEASLFQLHGYSGTGTARFRIDGQCHCMAIRLIAGDFGGRKVGINHSGPIRIWIKRSEIVQALYEGQDLVSQDFLVLAKLDGETADIVIEAGLSAETGFVINPGRSVLADLFGARRTPIPCSTLGVGV